MWRRWRWWWWSSQVKPSQRLPHFETEIILLLLHPELRIEKDQECCFSCDGLGEESMTWANSSFGGQSLDKSTRDEANNTFVLSCCWATNKTGTNWMALQIDIIYWIRYGPLLSPHPSFDVAALFHRNLEIYIDGQEVDGGRAVGGGGILIKTSSALSSFLATSSITYGYMGGKTELNWNWTGVYWLADWPTNGSHRFLCPSHRRVVWCPKTEQSRNWPINSWIYDGSHFHRCAAIDYFCHNNSAGAACLLIIARCCFVVTDIVPSTFVSPNWG